jgi:hypothetical protein
MAEWKADMNFTERPAVNALYLFGEAQSTNEHATEKFPQHIYTPLMGSKWDSKWGFEVSYLQSRNN